MHRQGASFGKTCRSSWLCVLREPRGPTLCQEVYRGRVRQAALRMCTTGGTSVFRVFRFRGADLSARTGHSAAKAMPPLVWRCREEGHLVVPRTLCWRAALLRRWHSCEARPGLDREETMGVLASAPRGCVSTGRRPWTRAALQPPSVLRRKASRSRQYASHPSRSPAGTSSRRPGSRTSANAGSVTRRAA